MRKESYLTTDYQGTPIEGACLIVNNRLLYIKMEQPYQTYITIEIENSELTQTEDGIEILFRMAHFRLLALYRTIKIISENKAIFERLWNNFNAVLNMQSIRITKKRFYSDTEREYYERNVEETLNKSFDLLCEKYVGVSNIDFLSIKKTLTPVLLQRIMNKVLK